MAEAGSNVPPILTAVPVGVLEYARPMNGIDPASAKAARLMVGLAVLSGLCVAVCFANFMFGAAGAILHTLVYAATIWIALRVGTQMSVARQLPRPQLIADGIAGLGLIGLALAPGLHLVFPKSEELGAGYLSVSFLLMVATTFRHRLLYQRLALWCVICNRPSLSKNLRLLGNVKMVYEGLWLACCAFPLGALAISKTDDSVIFLAYGALFGCIGFGVIWIWMIVSHVKLAKMARGFEGGVRFSSDT